MCLSHHMATQPCELNVSSCVIPTLFLRKWLMFHCFGPTMFFLWDFLFVFAVCDEHTSTKSCADITCDGPGVCSGALNHLFRVKPLWFRLKTPLCMLCLEMCCQFLPNCVVMQPSKKFDQNHLAMRRFIEEVLNRPHWSHWKKQCVLGDHHQTGKWKSWHWIWDMKMEGSCFLQPIWPVCQSFWNMIADGRTCKGIRKLTAAILHSMNVCFRPMHREAAGVNWSKCQGKACFEWFCSDFSKKTHPSICFEDKNVRCFFRFLRQNSAFVTHCEQKERKFENRQKRQINPSKRV